LGLTGASAPVFFVPWCNLTGASSVFVYIMEKALYIKLLNEHRDCVYSVAVYNLRDADDAADITQEAFLRLWRHQGDLNRHQAKAWLLRVTHNLCIDQSRRRKTVRTYFGVPDSEAVDQLKSSITECSDPCENLHQQQQQQALLESMNILPEETRSIMMLHYFQDLKIQEIAGLLGLKASTIKVRLHRARKTLRRHLTETRIDAVRCQREMG